MDDEHALQNLAFDGAEIFINEISVRLVVIPYKLQLRSAFGTSHSSSMFRVNALFVLLLNGEVGGVGEIGLPPKKRDCYEADLEDCVSFAISYWNSLNEAIQRGTCAECSPFQSLATKYFEKARTGGPLDSNLHRVMLQALDHCPMSSSSFGRAGRSGVESCLIDSWARSRNVTVFSLLNLAKENRLHKSFYTAALNDSIDSIVASARVGSHFTPNLKIKLNDSISFNKAILRRLDEAFPSPHHGWWSIDANCAWTPEIAMEMLTDVLMPFKPRIYMVEQPFPVDVCTTYRPEWIKVKEMYNASGINIFADESVRTWEDVAPLQLYANGVNIKLEKCGGYCGALRLVDEATRCGVEVWFGCMVGSNLNSTATAHLISLATEHGGSDLDGSILVARSSMVFDGGFVYAKESGGIILPRISGVGVLPNKIFSEHMKGILDSSPAKQPYSSETIYACSCKI